MKIRELQVNSDFKSNLLENKHELVEETRVRFYQLLK